MNQNNIILSLFILLSISNAVDAMKRPRNEGTMQLAVVATVAAAPTRIYWDGKSPYDGSMVIKPTADHHCGHCNKWITDESLAAHALGKHSNLYMAPKAPLLPPAKRQRIADFSSGSSYSSTESSSDSSEEMEQDKSLLYVTKFWKNGRAVQHVRCDVEDCKFATARVEEMHNHKKLHQVDDCQVCAICDFRASAKKVFTNHSQTHLPKEERSNTVICSICNKLFAKQSSLNRHMENQHSGHV